MLIINNVRFKTSETTLVVYKYWVTMSYYVENWSDVKVCLKNWINLKSGKFVACSLNKDKQT